MTAPETVVDRDLENALVVRVGLLFRPRMSGTPTGNGRIMGHLSWQYIWFDDLTGNGTGRVPMSPRLPLA